MVALNSWNWVSDAKSLKYPSKQSGNLWENILDKVHQCQQNFLRNRNQSAMFGDSCNCNCRPKKVIAVCNYGQSKSTENKALVPWNPILYDCPKVFAASRLNTKHLKNFSWKCYKYRIIIHIPQTIICIPLIFYASNQVSVYFCIIDNGNTFISFWTNNLFFSVISG